MTESQPKNQTIDDLGQEYKQFYHKPKDAIRHLRKVKNGQCIAALYRDDIGNIDIVWGKVTDPVKHTGFGLAHIIDKHEKDINNLGFEIEDFIPIVVQYGNLTETKSKEEYLLESKHFRVVIEKFYHGKSKQWLLSAFELRKKPKSK